MLHERVGLYQKLKKCKLYKDDDKCTKAEEKCKKAILVTGFRGL
jgi:hypothetical protein